MARSNATPQAIGCGHFDSATVVNLWISEEIVRGSHTAKAGRARALADGDIGMRVLVISLSTYSSSFNDGKLVELARRVEQLQAVAGDVPTLWGTDHSDRTGDGYTVRVLPLRWAHLNATARLRGLREIADLAQPTIIHIECEPWQAVARQAISIARKADALVGVQFAENGPNLRGVGGVVRLALARRTFAHCDYAVGWSEGSSDVARNLRPDLRVETFPATGVAACAAETGEEASGGWQRWFGPGAAESLKVAFVGRFSPEKGIEDFLAICDSLAAQIPLSVAIAGGGASEEAVVAWAAARPWVRVHGILSRPDAQHVLAAADLLIVPSRTTSFAQEQFGKAPVEAMTLGTPVFAYDCGALAEVIGPGGRLVREGARDELAREVISYAAGSHSMRFAIGEKARRQAEQFSDAALADRLVSLWIAVDAERR
jgi:glycosyltransferase involved in cell wall biosynthesis